MARAAVLASGSGTNFQSIAEAAAGGRKHEICFLACDRKHAFVFERARLLGIPAHYIGYARREREEAEHEIIRRIEQYRVDLIILAGFMRILSPGFVDRYAGRIVNIHPSLLPKYPGTHGIEESFRSADRELGITVHRVDRGTDTGPVILQRSFLRNGHESLAEIEERIHRLEHESYPEVILALLDAIEESHNSEEGQR